MSKAKLTADRLRELLDYDPQTGLFTWRRTRAKARKGAVAGTPCSYGYVKIGIDNEDYRAHRLAWLYCHGEWPSDQIDHIDGDIKNNAINNLRDVSTSVNQQNLRRAKAHSTHGYMGTSKRGEKWAARITTNGVFRHLGVFATAEEAHAAYIEAKRLVHPGCTI